MLKQNESELLSAYADKELVGDELTLVQERLTSSMEWREELERLLKTKSLTTALRPISAPLDLLDSLEEQINLHLEKKQSGFRRFFAIPQLSNSWAMVGTFATAAVFVVSLGAYRMHEKAFIPLEPLLAAHTQTSADSLLHQNVLVASLHSSQLKTHENN